MRRTFLFILSLLCPLAAYQQPGGLLGESSGHHGSDTHTVTVNGRVITEESYSSYYGTVYNYKLSDKMSAIDSIKHKKLPFSVSTKYPVWTDPLGIKQVFKNAAQHAKNCFVKNHNGIIPEEIVNSVYILIDDNGSVFCEIIWAKTCLFDIYSAGELISIFDEISTFKFPTPVVVRPKSGYEIMGLDFWSEGEKDDEEDTIR